MSEEANTPEDSTDSAWEEIKAMRRVIANLRPFSPRARERILRYALDEAQERQAEQLGLFTTTPTTEG